MRRVALVPWRRRPGLFHALSLLLHTAASLLVYRLVWRYTAHDWAAAVGALVFAIHPLQVESVAWVAEQQGLLAAVLSLTATDRFSHWLDQESGTSTLYQTATWQSTGTLAERACRITLGDTGAWTMLAGISLATGRSDRALECAYRALHIAPSNHVALLNAFGAAVRLGLPEQAADTCGRLRHLGYDGDRLVEVFYNRGVSDLKAGRHTEAAVDFRIALTHDPDHPWAATNLGVTLTRLGRHDEAVTVLRASLDRAPDHAAGWVALGNSLLTQGSAAAAVGAYTRALAIEPDDAAALMNRAWAGLQAGDRAAAARDAAAAATRGHPWDPDLRTALGSLGAPP